VRRVVLTSFLLVALLAFPSFAAPPPLVVNSEPVSAGGHLSLLFAKDGQMSPDEALRASAWGPVAGPLRIGYTDDYVWLRLDIRRKGEIKDWLLSFSNALLDEVQLYRLRPDGWSVQLSGENLGRERWAVDARAVVLSIALDSAEPETLLVRLRSKNALSTELTLWPRDSYDNASRRESIYYGLYFGLYIVLIFFHTFFWGMTREEQSGWYLSYLIFGAMVEALTAGLPQQIFLMPVGLSDTMLGLSMCVAMVVAIKFSLLQLQIDSCWPGLMSHFVRIGLVCAVIAGVCIFLGRFSIGVRVIQYVSMLMIALFVAMACYLLAHEHKPARVFLIVFGIYYAGVVISYLRNFSLLPVNFFTVHCSSIGSILHMVLMSLRLISRYDGLRREKEAAQLAAVKAVHDMNEDLEKKVAQRTSDLCKEIERRTVLEGELRVFLDAERQMNEVRQEFVAMVSHEFNTPLAIIDTTAQQIARNLGGPKEKLLERCRNLRNAAHRMMELVDRYLVDAREGADVPPFRPVTCNTIQLINKVREGWRDERVQVECKNLPLTVRCDEGLVLVALRNLLANAERHAPIDDPVRLSIEGVADGGLCIEVSNGGEAIPEEEVPLLFLKFFRGRQAQSKQGSGLGLYIVRHIARMHGGDVVLKSSGATEAICFALTLPGSAQVTEARSQYLPDIYRQSQR